MDLQDKVKNILEKYAYTRNCDTNLTIKLWEIYYPGLLSGGVVKLENLHYLPTQADIKRHRAIIQNNMGLYLPTSGKVAQGRKMSLIRWVKLTREAA